MKMTRKIFFTSDTCFNSKKVLNSRSRPFKNKEEMNRYLVKTINNAVLPNDVLFHVGYFAETVTSIIEFRKRLNCNTVFLILGENDPKPEGYRKYFADIFVGHHIYADILMSYYVPNKEVVLNHQGPVLHGYKSIETPFIDVSLDNNDEPLELEEIYERFNH